MTTALQTLTTLNTYIPHYAVCNEEISKWSVGMQIEHCLLSTIGIGKGVVHSQPYAGKIKKGVVRRLIFLTGMIPRGRGRAPAAAVPSEHTSESELQKLIEKASLLLQQAAESDPACWWQHFAFGVMQRDEALKFIAIHNQHHLKIIKDILLAYEA